VLNWTVKFQPGSRFAPAELPMGAGLANSASFLGLFLLKSKLLSQSGRKAAWWLNFFF
jgi:hypothetical protein